MEIKRKLQLGAIAVIANGLLALTLAAPKNAFAGSCNPYAFCFTSCPSQTVQNELCGYYEPPGCTVASTACAYSSACAGEDEGLTPYYITCSYT